MIEEEQTAAPTAEETHSNEVKTAETAAGHTSLPVHETPIATEFESASLPVVENTLIPAEELVQKDVVHTAQQDAPRAEAAAQAEVADYQEAVANAATAPDPQSAVHRRSSHAQHSC